MATPVSPSSSIDRMQRELTELNTIVTESHPTYPGINVYVGNVGAQPIPVTFGSGAISISASFPTTQSVDIIGVTPISGYLPVVISGGFSASGGGVTPSTTDSTGSFAYHSSSSTLIMPTNTSRLGFKIYNDTDSTYVIFFGLTASLNKITTVIPSQWTYEDGPVTIWQGPVAGIGSGGGSGTIYWTELRP